MVGGHTFFPGSSRPRSRVHEVVGHADLSLTRAVVQYRERHQLGTARTNPSDVGMALVLDGQYAASTSGIDLGSTRLRELDLSGELVVLGWVGSETLTQVTEALSVSQGADRNRDGLGPLCFGLALRILDELGFTPVTRPSHLRIGFIDICRDLDGDGDGTVRIDVGREGVVRVGFDADHNVLAFAPSTLGPHHAFSAALQKAFGGLELRRRTVPSTSPWRYQARLPLPGSLAEARAVLERVRIGLTHLIAQFEARRYRALREQTSTFGQRDTLSRLRGSEEPRRWEVLPSVTRTDSRVVH